MDTELEQHFLDKEKYSDNQIEELREKQYYSEIRWSPTRGSIKESTR